MYMALAMPTNDTDFKTYSTNHMESISYHIRSLVINSPGGRGHTHETHINTHTGISGQSNFKKLGNQQPHAPVLKVLF